MLVYRVETRRGVGPYNLDSYSPERCYSYRHPDPWDEQLLRPGEVGFPPELFFGFTSLNKLTNWFDHATRLEMKDHNTKRIAGEIVVSVYRVPKKHVRIGKCQVAFNKDKATLIERLDILRLS